MQIRFTDVPHKKPRETEEETYAIFVEVVNRVFKVIVEKKEIAACHRHGKVNK